MQPLRFAAALLFIAVAARADDPPTYERDVRPILRVHCFHCHGDDGVKKSELDLRLRRLIVQGGKKGAAIVPGKPGESRLLDLIKSGKMPDEGKPVPPREVEVIERWIAAGAPAGDEPQAAPGEVSDADRRFWSFQPIVKTLPKPHPQALNPIDSFLLDKLAEHKLGFSPQADRRTLIRRATFDLIGLPPSPSDVEVFVHDPAPDAYERLIDRLLNSPAYGERWGRHWLDVAGYADSEGYTPADPVRPFVYFYRDYVVHSLNGDLPWDRFITEQLAGDELVPLAEWDHATPEQRRTLAATGFLRMAPDGSASGDVQVKEASNANIAEMLKIVSTSMLGLTVGCAQCHTHKYDPIPQTDYYRLRAVFEPALNPAAWRKPAQHLYPIVNPGEREKAAAIEAEAAKVDAQVKARSEEFVAKLLEREIAKVPEEKRAAVLATRDTPADKRTPEQKALAVEFINAVNLSANNLQLYDVANGQELDKLREQAAAIRKTKPPDLYICLLHEPINEPPPTTVVFHRGDPNQPKGAVTPGVLSVLDSTPSTTIPLDDPASPFTGRRLAFARHLTGGQNPLVARVLVNRFWLHHFGRGLVPTPGDFGHTGEPPSHPRLLDWLAADFMEHGWHLKRLHRLMMTSAAYRQSSAPRPELKPIDPDNRLLARMTLRRLEAEALRDAVMSVTGDLLVKLGGPPVPVAQDAFGQIITAIELIDGNGHATPIRDLGGEQFRRSVYVQVRRSKPLSMLDTFDLPSMEPNCERRSLSTVAPQSLMLMNAEAIVEAADRFATRIEREAGSDATSQVALAWRLAFGRSPAEPEQAAAVAFLGEQVTRIAAQNPPPSDAPADTHQKRQLQDRHAALASFCQALLGSNEFLYID